ncbi:MAG: hypothetical protein J6I40_00885 [Mailhella sp.]|nr:hypothetical protein [Mailhella sp.]
MSYYVTSGLVLSKDGDQALRARIASLSKDQAAIANSFLKYPDQKKTHRKTGAKLLIWNAAREGPNFDLFFGRLVGLLPYEDYKLLRIGDALDDSMEDGGFFDDPFSLRIERTLLYD